MMLIMNKPTYDELISALSESYATALDAEHYASQIRQKVKPNQLQQQCLVCGEYHGNNMPCPSLQPMAKAGE